MSGLLGKQAAHGSAVLWGSVCGQWEPRDRLATLSCRQCSSQPAATLLLLSSLQNTPCVAITHNTCISYALLSPHMLSITTLPALHSGSQVPRHLSSRAAAAR